MYGYTIWLYATVQGTGKIPIQSSVKIGGILFVCVSVFRVELGNNTFSQFNT